LGRLLFAVYLAPQSKVNDLYSFGLGLYIMVIMGTVAHKITTLYVSYRENEYKLDKDEAMQFLKENTKKVNKQKHSAIL
jgi:hypothetical protein